MAAALGAAATAVPGVAHEAGIPTVSVIDRVTPQIDGVEVTIHTSIAPALQVRNRTERTVTIVGVSGEPYARIAPGGIEVNDRSPTTYMAADPFERRPLPAQADPKAEPDWRSRGTGAGWRWFDPRIRAPGPQEPVVSRKVLRRWTVPVRVGDREVRIEGHVEPVGVHGHLRTVLDGIEPLDPKMKVQVLEGPIPALFVLNETGRELAVPGQEGEPFLRLAPDGVFANTRSPTWFLAGNIQPSDVPQTADAEAPPEWTKLSPKPNWAWLEYRARVPADARPYDLGPEPKTVLRWTTPLTLAGAPVKIRGHVDWVPAADVEPSGGRAIRPAVWAVLGLLVGALAAAVLLLRQRPGAGSTPPAPAP